MARQLRLEYEGALYHVTARGNGRQAIYLDDLDRRCFLDLLGREVEQQQWRCYAYCLMDTHYHLLLETPKGNLSSGMRRLNGTYTQAWNRRQIGSLLNFLHQSHRDGLGKSEVRQRPHSKLQIVNGSGLQVRRGMMTAKKKEKFLVNGISYGIEMAWGKSAHEALSRLRRVIVVDVQSLFVGM